MNPLIGAITLAAATLIGITFVDISEGIRGTAVSLLLIVTAAAVFFALFSKAYSHPFWLLAIIAIGLSAKVVISPVRGIIAIDVYNSADAERYYAAGVNLGQQFIRLDLSGLPSFTNPGTDFMGFYSALAYLVAGTSITGQFLLFSSVAVVGSYCFYRGFVTAFPHGKRSLFAVLVFLYPSLLYWPSGVGKDALMILFLGLVFWGSASVIRHRPSGLILFGIGLVGAYTIRPHIAAIVAVAFTLGIAMSSGRDQSSSKAVRLLLVGGMGVLGLLVFQQIKEFIGLETISPSAVTEFLQLRAEGARSGGSAFQAASLASPMGAVTAIITVLFRPFPWEANNLQSFIQALEGSALALMVLIHGKTIVRSFRDGYSRPFAIYIVVYLVLLSFAFTAISNFGTLARERAMLLPFIFVLFAMRLGQPTPIIGKSQAQAGTGADE